MQLSRTVFTEFHVEFLAFIRKKKKSSRRNFEAKTQKEVVELVRVDATRECGGWRDADIETDPLVGEGKMGPAGQSTKVILIKKGQGIRI